jgi:Chaperone of endosialidase
MKSIHSFVGSTLLALAFTANVQAQNVGIGVSNPQSKLSVNGTTASGGLAIGDATYTSTAGTVAPVNGAIIKGNVGIGLTTPQVPLHVDGQEYVSAGGVTGQFWNGTANINGIQLNPAGYIGAQRSDGSPLHLSKATGFTDDNLIIFSINNVPVGSVTTTGTSVSYNTTSDERLKENIRPTSKGLEEVMQIRVSDYNFKSRPHRTETGFIAQQLYTVLPEVVTPGGEDPSVKPWTVDYSRVTPLLTRAIQEQQAEIDALKEQNRNQASEITALKAANAKLQEGNRRLAEISSQMEALKKAVTTIQEKENGVGRAVALDQ